MRRANAPRQVRFQAEKSRPLYEKRQKVVSQIPNFWPLVVEQAPPDIDEFIQPSDQSLLLSRLTSLSVSHFEIENGGQGNPRSIAFRWEFAENEYFEDRVLEKKFWYRHADDGWSGLVSEPVDIKWKGDNDLTGGLLGLAKRAWDAEQALAKDGKAGAGKQELIPEQKELRQKIEETGLGGMSFFGWFGFRGRRVSAEESRAALEKLKLRLAEKKRGAAEEDKEDKEEEEEDDLEGLEIFPEGDTLAVTIAEDLWPGAIKYFSKYWKPLTYLTAVFRDPNIRSRSPSSRSRPA